MAPGVLSTKLETTFQKVRVARYIQVHRLQQRPNVGEGASLVAGLRGFDGIANFHSRDWQKTNAPSNCLIVIVIGEVIEVENPGALRIIGDEAGPIEKKKEKFGWIGPIGNPPRGWKPIDCSGRIPSKTARGRSGSLSIQSA